MRKALLGVAFVFLMTACSDRLTSPAAPLAEVRSLDARGSDDDQTVRYIVQLRGAPAGVVGTSADLAATMGFETDYVYSRALSGFAAELTPAQAAALRVHPMVEAIGLDGIVTKTDIQSPTPSWGLDRIDQNTLPLNSSYEYMPTGAGVTFYGLDTGIRSTHVDFTGRMLPGVDFIGDGIGTEDCDGHGTHTASTAAGTTYGVAKEMSLVPVRVLNCFGSGSFAQVIAGVDWVAANASLPAVANMSLSGGGNFFLDLAVSNAVGLGVTFVVAASNDNANACGFSPAREPTALTVGSTTITDNRSSFSNFGTCLDLFAPGSGITAAWSTSNTATNTISGTSMSAPHVAGVAGLYLESDPSATPAAVATVIVSNATVGAVSNPGSGSPNLLLYMGFLSGLSNQPPTASWVWNFASDVLTVDATSSFDPDGNIVLYEWLDDMGTVVATGGFLTVPLPPGFTYNRDVTLRVTDDDGGTDELTQTITIG